MPGLSPNPGGGRITDPVFYTHQRAVNVASKKYGIPAWVFYGLLTVEGGTDSAGRPVKPKDGAGPASYGQFTHGTGKALGVQYGSSMSEVDAIGRYLTQLGWRKGEDPDSAANKKALGSYNGGPANPQYDYANKVLTAGGKFRSATADAADAVGNVVGGAVGGAVDAATALPTFLGKLQVIFDGAWWLRVGMIAGGIVAMVAALAFVAKDFTPAGAVTKQFKRG